MPESTTRLAALRSGQVDWVELPPPDAMPGLTKAGFNVVTSPFPHMWPYWLKIADNTPFKDVRVRQAFNYAVDREGLVELLNGAAEAAKGFWKPGDPRFGKPKNDFKFDPAKAKALLAEAGVKTPVPVKILISTAGSGQMLPLPMNELLQQSARDADFDLSFSVVDFAQMTALRNKPDSPEMKDVIASNSSFTTADMTWFYFSFYPPNWPGYDNPEVTKLMTEFKTNFELGPEQRVSLLASIHEKLVDDSPWVWIVHDRNARAFAPSVKGYTPAQQWFTDLTTVYIQK
jgi:ABC-type transport system substrate-binding protein